MQTQLKIIQCDQNKRKSSARSQTATGELQNLMNFNQIISLAIARTMKHLSDFVFVYMANITLVRRDTYLDHHRYGIKQDTLAALLHYIWPHSVLKKEAEDDIAQHDNKGYFGSSSHKKR